MDIRLPSPLVFWLHNTIRGFQSQLGISRTTAFPSADCGGLSDRLLIDDVLNVCRFGERVKDLVASPGPAANGSESVTEGDCKIPIGFRLSCSGCGVKAMRCGAEMMPSP